MDHVTGSRVGPENTSNLTSLRPRDGAYHNKWMAASLDTARSSEHGVWFARRLREWCSTFIEEGDNLPVNVYGTWNKSQLDDENLKQEILTHLQGIGKYISTMDLA